MSGTLVPVSKLWGWFSGDGIGNGSLVSTGRESSRIKVSSIEYLGRTVSKTGARVRVRVGIRAMGRISWGYVKDGSGSRCSCGCRDGVKTRGVR